MAEGRIKVNRTHPPLPFVGSPTGPCDIMAFKENCLRNGRIKLITEFSTAASPLAAFVLNQGCFLKDD